MNADLLHSLVADGFVAITFAALIASLAAVFRHATLGGATMYALGHIGFTAGSSLFILLLTAGIPASQRPWLAWLALLASAFGSAAMVGGLAALLEHPLRHLIRWLCWAVATVIVSTALVPWPAVDPLKLASDLANSACVAGLAAVLLHAYPKPYRLPAWWAGVCAAALLPLYAIGSVQEWLGTGPVLVPHYVDWVWLDLALWSTFNLCVMMLASFRALTMFAQRARTDPLTGCLNRGGLQHEWEALSARLGANDPLSVMAIDIDHFKAINDHHGHAAGDAYLARFAGLLHSVVRHADLVVRMGGEEFLVVLHRAPRDVAERVAKDVVERTRDLAMDVGGVRVHTTASIGIAAGRGGDDMTDLIQQADRALYMAKTSGRDRVCVAGPTDARTGREPLSW